LIQGSLAGKAGAGMWSTGARMGAGYRPAYTFLSNETRALFRIFQ
jgi:hypothetical protein